MTTNNFFKNSTMLATESCPYLSRLNTRYKGLVLCMASTTLDDSLAPSWHALNEILDFPLGDILPFLL